MNSLSPILITFILYGVIIVGVATLATRLTKNLSDYVLGGRRISGPLTALGAGASDMSSWLLMALPGFVYLNGIKVAWMPIALVCGAYCNWRFVASRLRIFTETANDSLTIPAYLSNRFKAKDSSLRLICAIALLIFFTFYSVAGFVSGAMLIQSTFNIEYMTALTISATVIIVYTAVGGFLAVSWVDFFQGLLMFGALLVVPIVTALQLGGAGESLHTMAQLSPTHLDLFHEFKWLSILSLFAWGLGYFGQPHINVRFMAIRSIREMPIARFICMNWMIVSLVGAILTGLVGYLFYQPDTLQSPDTVFILLSNALFNPWIAGILLSAVLSAIMSTVSAQILMTASILVEDVYHGLFRKQACDKEFLWVSRICLVLVAGIAVIIAANPGITILQSVGFAWAGLGASFGPVLLFSLYWRRMTQKAAFFGVAVGMSTVVLWEVMAKTIGGGFFAHPDILPGFVILPGFILASIAIITVSLRTPEPSKDIQALFDKSVRKLHSESQEPEQPQPIPSLFDEPVNVQD